MITKPNEIIIGLTKTVRMKTRYQRGDVQHDQIVTINYTGSTISDLLDWASAERIIKFQNQIRALPNRDAFEAFMEVGDSINIFAFDANKDIENHTKTEDIIGELSYAHNK